MKKLLAFAALLPLLISCLRGRETMATLDDVFSYMDSRPDSALTVLEGMNEEDLTSRRIKAKHALLYSMALDKNWIDLTSDSIIAPAVSYFNNHGSSEEKLLTYYYRGRISMNAGNYEDAISYFILAERQLYDYSDKIMAGRLFKAQTIYESKRHTHKKPYNCLRFNLFEKFYICASVYCSLVLFSLYLEHDVFYKGF